MVERFEEKNVRKKIIIILSAIAVLLLSGAGIGIYNSPENRLARQLDLGYKYLQEGEYKEAILVFEQIITIDDNCIKAYAGELKAYIAIGDRDSLEEFYDKALSVVGGMDEKKVKTNMDYIVEIYMSACYVYGEGTEHAAEVLEEGLQITHGSSEVKKQLGNNYLILADSKIYEKEYDGAMSIYHKILELGGEGISESEIKEKINETEKMIEEENKVKEEEAKREQEKREKKEKQEEQEQQDKEIHKWMVRNLGLINEYPVMLGYSKSKSDIFYLLYGYEGDNYKHSYVFSVDGNIWTILEHSIWDGKVGEGEESPVNVGKSYDMTITDELRSKYEEYQESQAVFQEYANEFDSYLLDKGSDLTSEFELEDYQFEKNTDNGLLEGTIVYWEKGHSAYGDQIIMRAILDTALKQITITNVEMKGFRTSQIDYRNYKGTYELE